MSLGGYKFAGYKCEKPSGATDAQWALLIHKTRLKAFLAANTAASAGWSFDWSNGDEAFETYGNVIYYADGTDPLNLVSFFKHGSGDDTKYYMIATLFNWQQSYGSISGLVKISSSAIPAINAGGSTGYYIVNQKTLFHTVGYTRFPEDCLAASAGNYPQDALPLVPLAGWTTRSTTANTNSGTEKFKDANSIYIGCTVKGLNITTFTTRTDTLHSETNYLYTKVSIIGFDGLTLSSPDDNANIYGICLCLDGAEIGAVRWNNAGAFTIYQATLKDNFMSYFSNVSGTFNTLYLTNANTAVFNGSAQVYPFETVGFTTNGSRTVAPFLNSNGITSKGKFDIDLISCNGSGSYTNFTTWSSVANGNYLTALVNRTASSDNWSQTTYYIGWDPSNPDITSEDAWTAYDGT